MHCQKSRQPRVGSVLQSSQIECASRHKTALPKSFTSPSHTSLPKELKWQPTLLRIHWLAAAASKNGFNRTSVLGPPATSGLRQCNYFPSLASTPPTRSPSVYSFLALRGMEQRYFSVMKSSHELQHDAGFGGCDLAVESGER